MPAYKFYDGSKNFEFTYPYQDLLVSITEALKNQDFNAFIDLISHLRNLSILAFDEKDIKILEKIDLMTIKLKKHIFLSYKEKIDSESLYDLDKINSANIKESELKVFCEFRLSCVIERICISALRKTILRDQVPEAQVKIFFESSRDLELTLKTINAILEEYEISPCEDL